MDQIIHTPRVSRVRLAPAKGQRSLVPYLASTLVLMGALYSGLMAAPLMAEHGWRPFATKEAGNRLVEWRRDNFNPEQDPALGMDIPNFRLNTEKGKKVQVGGGGAKQTALLFVGDTSTCSVRSLMAGWEKIQKKHKDLRVVVVASHPDPKITGCTQKKANVEVVIDSNGAAAQAFNAQWKPRAYLLDKAGRLTYVQPETTMDPIAPLDAEAALTR